MVQLGGGTATAGSPQTTTECISPAAHDVQTQDDGSILDLKDVECQDRRGLGRTKRDVHFQGVRRKHVLS